MPAKTSTDANEIQVNRAPMRLKSIVFLEESPLSSKIEKNNNIIVARESTIYGFSSLEKYMSLKLIEKRNKQSRAAGFSLILTAAE
ncbi:MAG: hypothetical protein ABIA63_02930 [bacterium]